MKIVILFLSLFLSVCSMKDDRNINKYKASLHLKIAEGHLRHKKYPYALKELLIAERLDPKNPAIQNYLGLSYFIRSKIGLAEKHLLKAIRLDSNYTEAYIQLGNMYLKIGLYKKAFRYLKKASEDLLYVNSDKIFNSLADYYFKLSQFKKAIEYFEKSLNVRSLKCHYQILYGRSYLQMKNYREAKKKLNLALDVCKGTPSSLYYYGLTLIKLNFFDEARSILEQIPEDSKEEVNFYKKAQRSLNLINI